MSTQSKFHIYFKNDTFHQYHRLATVHTGISFVLNRIAESLINEFGKDKLFLYVGKYAQDTFLFSDNETKEFTSLE